MGWIALAVWLIGWYLIVSIRRPKKDAEVIGAAIWPIVYAAVYLVELSDVIHAKYWAWKALRPNKEDSKDLIDVRQKK
jgi:hypothetical protein